MDKRTILYLRTDLSNKPLVAGGSVAHTLGVIQGFLDEGYAVVCASSLMYEQLAPLKLHHLKQLKMPRYSAYLRWRLSCLFSTVLFTLQALPLIRSYKISMIYQRYSVLNFTGVVLSYLKNIPLILEYNGSEIWVDKHWSPKGWFKLSWLVHFIEMINVRRAHHLVVVSQALKDELVERGIDGKKILVNPNGVDVQKFDPAKLSNERTALRARLQCQDKIVICFVGSFQPWHGIEMIAKMAPEILAQHSSVVLLLIGDGPLRPWLQQHFKDEGINEDRSIFTGLVPQHAIPDYLAAADIFVSPTLPNPDGSCFFGSPTKLFEYMSMAKPIIASDLGQLGEVINPCYRAMNDYSSISNEVGILTEPANHQEFIQAVHTVINASPEYRVRMGINARDKAMQEYQWKSHVQKIVDHTGLRDHASTLS